MSEQANTVERVNYAGAVYGSLLAGSVVAGTSPGKSPSPALALMVVLLATGLVFWLAHVYALIVGDHVRGGSKGWAEIRAVGRAEWPLVKAAVPPAAVAGAGWLAGLADGTTAWLCLLVAVLGQMGWAMVAAARIGASARYIVTSGMVNLLLGLIIMALKAVVAH